MLNVCLSKIFQVLSCSESFVGRQNKQIVETHVRESAHTSFPMASQTRWFVPDVVGGPGSVSGEPAPGGSGSGNRDDATTVGTGVQFRLGPPGLERVGCVLL